MHPPNLRQGTMKKSLLKLLSSAALLVCAATPASAGIVHGTSFDLSYDEHSMIPMYYTGNTVTFTTTTYFSSYGPGYSIVKDALYATARAGVKFTGDVDIKTRIDYHVAPVPGYQETPRVYLSTIVDVLAPHCAECSIYDADLLGDGYALAAATSPGFSSGMANGAVDIANTFGGTYDRLALYVINDYGSSTGGMVHLYNFTVTLDTVGGPISSPVPELPPFALIGVGMLAIALRERLRKGRVSA